MRIEHQLLSDRALGLYGLGFALVLLVIGIFLAVSALMFSNRGTYSWRTAVTISVAHSLLGLLGEHMARVDFDELSRGREVARGH